MSEGKERGRREEGERVCEVKERGVSEEEERGRKGDVSE